MIHIQPCHNLEEWNTLFNQCPQSNVWQSSLYATLRAAPHFYVIYDAETPIGLFSSYRLKPGLRIINQGPLFIDPSRSDMINKSIRSLRTFTLPLLKPFTLLRPHHHPSLTPSSFIRFNNTPHSGTYLLDLSQSEETLRANLKGKWRNQLKKAEKEGLSFHEDKDALSLLLDHYDDSKQAKGFSGIPSHWVRQMANTTLSQHGILCVTVRLNDTLIGGAILACHGQCATYLIGWQNDAYRSYNVGNFYLWNSALRLKQQSYRYFDLGGVNTLTASSIAKFKGGLGGEWIPSEGTWL